MSTTPRFSAVLPAPSSAVDPRVKNDSPTEDRAGSATTTLAPTADTVAQYWEPQMRCRPGDLGQARRMRVAHEVLSLSRRHCPSLPGFGAQVAWVIAVTAAGKQ